MEKEQFYLGRKASKFDYHDYNLQAFMPEGLDLFKFRREDRYWPFMSEPLDQSTTPHCVGFSMANWGINLPVQDNYTNVDGHHFYDLCKIKDGDPDDGSTIRIAAKVLRDLQKINGYAFAPSIDVMKWWIVNKGPVICGTLWTMGMFTPDALNHIHPTGDLAGGHAYVINELANHGNAFGIQNSWGKRWGVEGRAYIAVEDFLPLFRNGGEVLAAVEL
jgi:hypothetical protein